MAKEFLLHRINLNTPTNSTEIGKSSLLPLLLRHHIRSTTKYSSTKENNGPDIVSTSSYNFPYLSPFYLKLHEDQFSTCSEILIVNDLTISIWNLTTGKRRVNIGADSIFSKHKNKENTRIQRIREKFSKEWKKVPWN